MSFLQVAFRQDNSVKYTEIKEDMFNVKYFLVPENLPALLGIWIYTKIRK